MLLTDTIYCVICDLTVPRHLSLEAIYTFLSGIVHIGAVTLTSGYPTRVSALTLLENVNCVGGESRVIDCPKTFNVQGRGSTCHLDRDVGINCTRISKCLNFNHALSHVA